MALPAMRRLRRLEEGSTITVHAPPAYAPLVRSWGVADAAEGLEAKGVFRVLRAARRLRGKGFDAALLLTNSFSSALLARLAGLREVWGYATDGRSLLLTRAERPRPELPQAEYYAELVCALYGRQPKKIGREDFGFDVPSETRREARELAGEGRLVALAPAAAYGPAKEWPEEHFAELCRMLARAGYACVLVGSSKDAAKCERIARLGQARSLAGRTDIMTLAGLFAEAEGFVGNDSGAAHLSAAVGTRTVAIFGSTRPERTCPRGRAVRALEGHASCIPCMAKKCPRGTYECLKSVSAHDVFEALTGAGWG